MNTTMTRPLRTAAIAGILGTLAFDAAGFAITGNLFDIPQLLAAKLETPLALGIALHYLNGIILSVLFTALSPLIPGNRWSKPLTYITVQTIVGVYLFMMPLVGAGAFGLKMGIAFPIIAMARHWLYALVLGAFSPKADSAPNTTSHSARVLESAA